MLAGLGQQAILHIVIHIFLLAATWWSLQCVRIDMFVREPKGPKAMLLMILLTIAIAHLVSEFFISYLDSSLLLKYLWSE